ncbi:MAG: hydroxyacid dehydrogenase [Eubacteriales bacterium]|jgi:phosphoglycerate dehydrogenase-like enzyme|nr:hydroxyacid dehydrogenase [Eubacteriales bacterium]
MKIAFIFAEKAIGDLFSQKVLDKLASIADLSLNRGDAGIENLKKTIAGADIAVTSWGTPPLTAEILDCAPGLRLVIHAAGSVKPIVTDALWERGIKVVSSAKPLGEGVAETTLGFTISACKNYYNLNAEIHAGGYRKGYEDIRELYGLTVGVVGAGWAGRHYIKLLQMFDVEILVSDPYLSSDHIADLGGRKTELEELLVNSDVVSLHAPSIPETRHMINAGTLSMMKRDAILINTARGSLVDEAALFAHMEKGNLKYACLDVYDPEPILPDNPLRSLPNVIMTPHIAGLAVNGKGKLGAHTLHIAQLYISGQPLECEVTEEMLATMA